MLYITNKIPTQEELTNIPDEIVWNTCFHISRKLIFCNKCPHQNIDNFPEIIPNICRIHAEWVVWASQNNQTRYILHERIVTDSAIMMGKPCIKDTHITVEMILRKLSTNRSFTDILNAYPQLTEDDLHAALTFAANYLQYEKNQS
jgi:uncharacterized protein (DUF433 family)